MMKFLVTMVLVNFCILAGLSKFGNTADSLFLPHSFMVDVYNKLTPKWNALLGLSLNPDVFRKVAGALEFAAALLMLSPMQSDPSHHTIGVSVLTMVMLLACGSHFLLDDPVPAYIVPGVALSACLYLLEGGVLMQKLKLK